MASKILADKLKRFEQLSTIKKAFDANQQSGSTYTLTRKGKELIPTMLEVMLWETKYGPNPSAPAALVRWLRLGRKGVVAAILECLKKPPVYTCGKQMFLFCRRLAGRVQRQICLCSVRSWPVV
jgi:DNA-binding MarR family transcriptional regulator